MATLYFSRDPSTSSTILIYKINNRLYNATTLAPILYGQVNDINAYLAFGPEDLSLFTSQPAILNTDEGYYLISSVGSDAIRRIIAPTQGPPTSIRTVRGFLLPDLTASNLDSDGSYPVYRLPSFNLNIGQIIQSGNLQSISTAMNRGGNSLSTTGQFINKPIDQPIYLSQVRTGAAPQLPSTTRPTIRPTIIAPPLAPVPAPVPASVPAPVPAPLPQGQELINLAIENYFKRIYGLPVTIPEQIQSKLIPFEQASTLLQTGQIASFKVEPFLQPLIGLPSWPNRLLTFIDRKGTQYYTVGRFDAISNKVNPPQN